MSHSRRRKILKRTLIAAVSIVTVVAIGLLAALASVYRFAATDKIAANVAIAGVPVGGLSEQAARAAVEEQLLPRLPHEVELTYPGGSWRVTRESLGASVMLPQAVEQARRVGREGGLLSRLFTHVRLRRKGIDVPVQTRVDEQQLRRTVVDVAGQLNCPPRDAEIKVVNDQVEIVPGEIGMDVQVELSVDAIRVALANHWQHHAELVVEVQPPAIATEDLADIEVVLSSYTTPFNPGQVGRTHNLKLAMNHVNETLVKPGEEFSLNEIVGPRLRAEGYRAAPIFKDGEIVPETGGGVCQVSTTIYNAALLANLEILERHHHSRPVVYCPGGRDATVYFGQLDMRFRNSLSYPILILGGREGNQLWTKILGKSEDDYDAKLLRTDVATLSFGVKEVSDPTLEAGKKKVETPGRAGLRVTLIREVYKDGELIKHQRLHTDTYRPQTKVVRVGTKEPEPPEEETAGPSLAPLPPVKIPPGVETGPLD